MSRKHTCPGCGDGDVHWRSRCRSYLENEWVPYCPLCGWGWPEPRDGEPECVVVEEPKPGLLMWDDLSLDATKPEGET